MRRTAATALVAAMVVLAGCAGGIGGTSGAQPSDSSTVAFYVSDEQNAVGQFSHLNVTVTKVGFATSGEAAGNASAAGSAGNATADGGAEADAEGWVTRDVESRTVDLTELQGANATLLGNVSVPAGEYGKTFVYVSGVEGTLESGEAANVKLPSQKLHLNEGFESDGTATVEFVFDITVVEAGNSGKFVLKPVASESGTDVEIDVVGSHGGSGAAANAAADFDVGVVGDAAAGETATVKVTSGGEAVANATLRADGEVVATTNENGTATVRVPEDGDLELRASADGDAGADATVELDLGAGNESGVGGASDSATADLAVAMQGAFAAGEQVTVVVTDGDGDAVANATVSVAGGVVGETNADGELTFEVPADASANGDVTVTANGTTVTVGAGVAAAAN